MKWDFNPCRILILQDQFSLKAFQCLSYFLQSHLLEHTILSSPTYYLRVEFQEHHHQRNYSQSPSHDYNHNFHSSNVCLPCFFDLLVSLICYSRQFLKSSSCLFLVCFFLQCFLPCFLLSNESSSKELYTSLRL
jgi:hypothetical protein